MDKFLTTKNWDKYCSTGKKSYKDDKFTSAMDEVENSEDDPQKLLDALDKLDEQTDKLLKANKGDKELEKYLKEVSSALDKARKTATADAKQAAKDAAKEAEADAEKGGDDADDPAELLLTTKTKAGLKLAHSGQEVPALISVAGNDAAVLVSVKPIGASQKKVLATHLHASGVKHFVGNCVLQGATYVFLLEASVGGLAKKITKALKEQLGLRYKVTVRSGGEDESDGEMDPQILAELGLPQEAPAAASAPAGGDDEAAPQAPPPPADDGQAKALMDRLRTCTQAMQDQALADDTRNQLRSLLQQAGTALQGRDYQTAGQMLDQADDLLAQAPDSADAPPASAADSADAPPGAPPAPPDVADDAPDDADQPATGAVNADTIKASLKDAMPTIRSAVDSGALPAAMLQQVVGKVNDLVGRKQFDNAHTLLAALHRNAKTGSAAQAKAHEGIDGAVQAWDGLRGQIDTHLQALKAAAIKAVREHNADPAATNNFDEGQVQTGLNTVDQVMDKLDTRLNQVLHSCRNKASAERAQLVKDVEAVIADYEKYIQSDQLFNAIDRSGFIDAKLQGVVSGVLSQVRNHLENVRL